MPSSLRARSASCPDSFVETLEGTFGPAKRAGNTVAWQSLAGPVRAILSDVDAIVAGGRRVRGAITVVQQLLLNSPKQAKAMVGLHNTTPGLGVARVDSKAPATVEVISRGNFHADEAEDNEKLGVHLAIAAICNMVSSLDYGAGPSEKRLPRHDQPCRWKPAEFISLAWVLDTAGDSVSVNGSTFVGQLLSLRSEFTELPEGGDPRLAISGEYRHPSFGKGLAAELSICIDLPLRAARRLAQYLNALEVNRTVGPPLLGAWSVDPTGQRLLYASFFPNVGYVPNLLPRIAAWSGERLHAVKDELQCSVGASRGLFS